jgi:2-polyprenyl-3-methyl-5-hydroxy-6-metoxy-1,4-benzoquinol methylase
MRLGYNYLMVFKNKRVLANFFYQKVLGRINQKFYGLNKKLDMLDIAINDLKFMAATEKYDAPFTLITDFPFAFSSTDFKSPKGSRMDYTRCPAFVKDVTSYFGRTISYLDIGCSNGGLVFDFLIGGNEAFGLEGSDFGIKNQSQHWRVIPNALGNADVTKPYQIKKNGLNAKFDVIGAWEVLEHINEEDLDQFFVNVANHLHVNGVFMASVAQFPDFDPATGQVWHVTLQSREWWIRKFQEFGFKEIQIPPNFHYPRGDGNPTVYDWDAKLNSEAGFHVFLQLN